MSSRTVTLFNRTGASNPILVNGTYPTSLSAALGEQMVYNPGCALSWEFEAKVTTDAAGNPVKMKFQGTQDPPDPLTVGSGNAAVNLVAANPLATVQVQQQTGLSVALTHSLSGQALILKLGTDATGKGNTNGTALISYITTNLAAWGTATAGGDGSGIMGATDLTTPVPQAPSWSDLLSLRQDANVEQAEHVLAPGVGKSATIGFALRNVQGWAAIRALGQSVGAPATTDALAVSTTIPGGFGEV